MATSGILIVNKPKGLTSHQVVESVRRIFGVRRVGHTGTLDPAATGVLVLLVGKSATRLSKGLAREDKEYVFSVEFGKSTDTGDSQGKVVREIEVDSPKLRELTQDKLRMVLKKFQGRIQQKVPWFSAVKVGGRKLYQLARKKSGEELQELDHLRPVREVEIEKIKLLEFYPGNGECPKAKIKAVCSKGTYTRVLAEDIGKALDVPAFQKELCRTRVGKFSLPQAVDLAQLEQAEDPAKFLLSLPCL